MELEKNVIRLHKECIGIPGVTRIESFREFSSDLNKISMYDTQIKNLSLSGKSVCFKMDIEGGEYDSITYISDKNLQNINFIALEIHDIWKRNVEAKNLITRLGKNFTLIHMHQANCCCDRRAVSSVIELTFVNNKFVPSRKRSDLSTIPNKT